MKISKAIAVVLAALVMMPVLAADWGDWEWDCNYGDYEDSSNFLIYVNATKYYSGAQFLELTVKPKIDNAEFLMNYSEIRISENSQPLIPAFDFPSDLFLSRSYKNGSFFVPYIPSLGEEKFELMLAANLSVGEASELRCTTKAWIPLPEISDPLPRMDEDAFMLNVFFEPATRRFNFTVRAACPEPDEQGVCGDEILMYLAVVDTQTNKVAEVRTVSLDRPITASSEVRHADYASSLQYDSFEVANGRYKTYVFAFDMVNDQAAAVYLKETPIFDFKDFELIVGTLPNIVPGESGELHLTLRNVGTQVDKYAHSEYVMDGLRGFTIAGFKNLEKGETADIIIKFEVSEYEVGSKTIVLNIRSLGSGLSKNYTIVLTPEKRIDMVPTVTAPMSLTAYDTNPINITFLFESTIQPRVFWTVFTDPALVISKGFGYKDLLTGSTINKVQSSFDLGGSCALGMADTEAFNAGRKVLIYSLAAYDISSGMDNESVGELEGLLTLIDNEKLSMATTASSKLFSRTERLVGIIENIIDAYKYGASDSRQHALREDLYLFTVDFENELRLVGERMSEECTAVDNVNFYLYVFSGDTLQEWIKSRQLNIEGSTVIELIGPKQVKAISGDSVSVDYIVKNLAGEDFEVDVEPTSDIVYVTPYFSLKAGESKTISLRFRPPDYYETDDEKIFVKISTRDHEISFPILLSVGEFDPRLQVEDVSVIPGTEAFAVFAVSTGGLDDNFEITSDCPAWVEFPDSVSTQEGFGNFTVAVAPAGNLKEGTYSCEFRLVPKSFPDYTIRKDFVVSVSAEALTLRERSAGYWDWYMEVKDSIERADQITIENNFDKANRYINQGEYTSAKLALNKIETSLSNVKQEERRISPLVFVAVGSVLVIGFILWKFVLVKKPKTGQSEKAVGAGGEDLI